MMDSESARMSSAMETRFRVDYPNSKPRVVKVVALDEASERVVKRVAQRQWQRATFFTSIKFENAPRSGESWSMQAWLSDLAGRRHRRSLRRPQSDDHGADHRQRSALERGAVENAGDAAALRIDARYRHWRRIHRGDAVGVAGVDAGRRSIRTAGTELA